ncbi:hypothetical protein [Desulfospira joergensenii]|uniref:hypothetical protein n=1 Tax=Desulfospira joergensenii TaxID=53329 RepID=UPI0003B51500|nr:hypothetical protein [Desulfospira joergensenii]
MKAFLKLIGILTVAFGGAALYVKMAIFTSGFLIKKIGVQVDFHFFVHGVVILIFIFLFFAISFYLIKIKPRNSTD